MIVNQAAFLPPLQGGIKFSSITQGLCPDWAKFFDVFGISPLK
jgi:hypothetical protein